MRVTYLAHSGFLIELSAVSLLFDWWKGSLPPLPEGSVFLFGHTHVKMDEVRSGVRCLNPGSVSIPKDGSHSCLIYENGEFSFRILEE